MKRKGILVIVSGFSGAGKGTLMKRLMEMHGEQYALSVSMTTRQPRPGEQEGISYFFVDTETVGKTIGEKGLIEYASYCDNYYGTPRKYVEDMLEQGKDVILEIEIQGALKVKEQYPDALLLFVMAPSAEELKRRLVGRGTETEEVIRKRLIRASEEAEGIPAYDAVVINDDLDTCTEELHQMIRSAHYAVSRNLSFIDTMQNELKELAKGE